MMERKAVGNEMETSTQEEIKIPRPGTIRISFPHTRLLSFQLGTVQHFILFYFIPNLSADQFCCFILRAVVSMSYSGKIVSPM